MPTQDLPVLAVLATTAPKENTGRGCRVVAATLSSYYLTQPPSPYWIFITSPHSYSPTSATQCDRDPAHSQEHVLPSTEAVMQRRQLPVSPLSSLSCSLPHKCLALPPAWHSPLRMAGSAVASAVPWETETGFLCMELGCSTPVTFSTHLLAPLSPQDHHSRRRSCPSWMHLAGPLCPEHIILGKTQLQAMAQGPPTEGPCQHTVQVRPEHCYQAGTSSR